MAWASPADNALDLKEGVVSLYSLRVARGRNPAQRLARLQVHNVISGYHQ